MVLVQVYNPAMCCSTGVCGPTVDPKLLRFAADLDWLKKQGAGVERFNLSQQPAAFAAAADVKSALETLADEALPLIKVDGAIKSTGRFPSRAELAQWIGIEAPNATIYTDAIAELVALGAAIASNCETCFKFHFEKARNLGVSDEDMLRAVRTAQAVKDTPAKAVVALAERYLSPNADTVASKPRFSPAGSASCCTPSTSAGGTSNNGDCC